MLSCACQNRGKKGSDNYDSDIDDDGDDPLPPVLDTCTPPGPALPPEEVDQEQMVPMDPVEPPPPALVLQHSTCPHHPPDRF